MRYLDAVNDNPEFITACPPDSIVPPDTAGDALAYVSQNFVACRMTERIINRLEPVKIDGHEC
jgi:hypothetical protein